jgi:hypothetical protein
MNVAENVDRLLTIWQLSLSVELLVEPRGIEPLTS